MGSPDLTALLNEREWRRCFPEWDESDLEGMLEAFQHFCATFWCIRHPERGRILFDLREAQIETARDWLNHRYTIVLKARQIGFSTLCAAFSFWLAYGYSDRYILMLSRTEREAVSLLAKSKYGYRWLPQWMKVRGPGVITDNQMMLLFANESGIRSYPSNNESARGDTAYLVIMDEMAFLTNPEETWAAVEPVTDVGGRVIALSTANGEGNIFHTLWVASQDGTGRFHGIFHPWWADGVRDQAWYDAKASDTPDWQMAQEYPDNPEDAFLRSGRPVFNLEVIRSWEAQEAEAVGYLENGVVHEQDNGFLTVYKWPEEHGRYVIGADVALGLEHGDFSAAFVLDARNKDVCALWHGHIPPDVFGDTTLNDLGHFYNLALIGVEANSLGAATLHGLRRKSYKNIYYRRRPLAKMASMPTDLMGWLTTAQSKGKAVAELDREFRAGMVVPHKRTIQELKTFVREGDGKMHGSPHDDLVMALAIAVQMMAHAFLPEFSVKEEPGPGTFGWYDRQMLAKTTERRRIGSNQVRRVA